MKRATIWSNFNHLLPPHFNPRPREEGDLMREHYDLVDFISIHALVKRATGKTLKVYSNPSISIHALVKRATQTTASQTTHRHISIHALVKRATYGAGNVSVGLGDFNPRPREEGDTQLPARLR